MGYWRQTYKSPHGDIMDESLMITESEKFLNQIEKERLDLTNLKI